MDLQSRTAVAHFMMLHTQLWGNRVRDGQNIAFLGSFCKCGFGSSFVELGRPSASVGFKLAP
jgi:hypothetical protein